MIDPASSIAVLIVAAGRGHRAGGDVPKQYRSLAGIPVLARAIQAFQAAGLGGRIRCVIHPSDRALYRAATATFGDLLEPATGGATRQQSVLNGLRAFAAAPPRTILIHDAARPFVTLAVISAVAAAVSADCGAIAAAPVVDTLKRDGGGGLIAATVSRDRLWAAQTPQGFPFAPLLAAHETAARNGAQATDDAEVAEAAGLAIRLIESGSDNIKLTSEDDIAMAERRVMNEALPDIRVGHGYDVHALEPGDGVVLGGVAIDHHQRLRGHSDADVALHTITDAIYGAIADGDIGQHFPPSDPQWKGAASEGFLRHAVGRVADRGGRINHIDLTLICEEPKIGPYRERIRQRIAAIVGIAADRISVKATTTERLGFTGRGEGIAASATATVALPAGRASENEDRSRGPTQ